MLKNKNDQENVSTWTYECSQSFLKSHKAVQQGSRTELHARCELLKKVLSHDLENLMSISKKKLRSKLVELAFQFGTEMSKDNLIKNMADAFIDE